MMKHTLSVLGSTGSIGTQTLDVVRNLGLSVCALAARGNVRLLEEQIREFKPRFAAVFDPEAAKRLRLAVRDLDVTVAEGMDGLCEAASLEEKYQASAASSAVDEELAKLKKEMGL